jgi:carbon-monoxide dehydrogenase large subunit
MGARYFGAAVRRREDPRLLTGNGRFVDDIQLSGMLHAAFLRSVHPHAGVRAIRTDAAARMPGVVGIWTFDDLARWMKPMRSFETPPASLLAQVSCTLKQTPQYPLARERVRYVGEALAVVVAESRYAAEDALEGITVEYEPLPPVTDAMAGAASQALRLHADWPDNLAVALAHAVGDVAGGFRAADVVVRGRFRTQRCAGMPIEPRAVVSAYDVRADALTVWSTTQVVHLVQQSVAEALEMAPHRVRVVAADVGGGFGTKACAYAEEIVVPLIARECRRPVKWTETRREHMMGSAHGRDQLHEIEIAATGRGEVLALRDRVWVDLGAYNAWGLVLPYNAMAGLLGPYRIRNFAVEVNAIVTNKAPNAPYRGAGRPEATFAMDRILDRLAREVRMDPAEIRRRNAIPADEMPYGLGIPARDGHPLVYDSGDFPAILESALKGAAYSSFREEQADLRSRGIYRGIGISAYVEGTGRGPYEGASVRLDLSGRALVATGACSQGQGHETTLAQIAADTLDVPLDWVTVVDSDTDRLAFGIGTFASRSAVVAGNAVAAASRQVREQVLEAAATILEARAADLELKAGEVHVRGVPASAVPLSRIVRGGLPTFERPGTAAPFEATVYHHAPVGTYASAVHVAQVEVDAATGAIRLLRYVVAHDCGRVINPMIVEGQIHGGVAQGIGGALWEELVYDDAGQVLASGFMDYHLPCADELPAIETIHLEYPSPLNPLGMKGVGEGGAISPPAAIANAVEDALAPYGVEVSELPLTSYRVAELLRAAATRGTGRGSTP